MKETKQIAAARKSCAGDLQAIENESIRNRALEALATFQSLTPDALRQKIGLGQQTRFELDPENPGGFVRISPDGSRICGVMNGRTFVPADI